VRNLARFQHHSTLSRPRLKTQQDIRTLKQKCNPAMIALYVLARFGKVGSTRPWESSIICTLPAPKIARRKRAESSNSAVDYSILLKFCTQFKSIRPKCFKSSKSRGQGHSVT